MDMVYMFGIRIILKEKECGMIYGKIYYLINLKKFKL